MRSNIEVFRRPDRLKEAQAKFDLAELERALAGFRGSEVARKLLAEHVAVLRREVAERIEALPFREFLAMYTRANWEVVCYLRKQSRYKVIAPVVWALILDCVQDVSYEVMATRRDLEIAAEASPRAVQQVLKELVDFKALRRLREPEPGKQGRGSVRYFLNARVGSHETHEARVVAFNSGERLGRSALPTEGRSRAAVVPVVAL